MVGDIIMNITVEIPEVSVILLVLLQTNHRLGDHDNHNNCVRPDTTFLEQIEVVLRANASRSCWSYE